MIVAENKKHLNEIIYDEIVNEGYFCDLNHIDVSNIEDFSYLFITSEFNGNISKWNTSNAITMEGMFQNGFFTGDVSEWDVSKVINCQHMFYSINLKNKNVLDISKWKINSKAEVGHLFFYDYFFENFHKDKKYVLPELTFKQKSFIFGDQHKYKHYLRTTFTTPEHWDMAVYFYQKEKELNFLNKDENLFFKQNIDILLNISDDPIVVGQNLMNAYINQNIPSVDISEKFLSF